MYIVIMSRVAKSSFYDLLDVRVDIIQPFFKKMSVAEIKKISLKGYYNQTLAIQINFFWN